MSTVATAYVASHEAQRPKKTKWGRPKKGQPDWKKRSGGKRFKKGQEGYKQQQMHKAFVVGSHRIWFVQKYFHVVGIA